MLTPDDIQQINEALGTLDLTIREHTVALREHTAALVASRTSAPAPQAHQPRGDDGGGTAYAPPARQTFTGAWQEFTIPFGKQAGRTLGSLPSGSLTWWIENYQPKPYNGNPPRPSDLAFRAALDAAKDAVGASAKAPAPANNRPGDLPLEKQNNLVHRDGTPAADEDVPF
jgi:hypothetical protein